MAAVCHLGVASKQTTVRWRRDEQGNLYRLLTPAERQKLQDARGAAGKPPGVEVGPEETRRTRRQA
jgi:hypothetical protein